MRKFDTNLSVYVNIYAMFLPFFNDLFLFIKLFPRALIVFKKFLHHKKLKTEVRQKSSSFNSMQSDITSMTPLPRHPITLSYKKK